MTMITITPQSVWAVFANPGDPYHVGGSLTDCLQDTQFDGDNSYIELSNTTMLGIKWGEFEGLADYIVLHYTYFNVSPSTPDTTISFDNFSAIHFGGGYHPELPLATGGYFGTAQWSILASANGMDPWDFSGSTMTVRIGPDDGRVIRLYGLWAEVRTVPRPPAPTNDGWKIGLGQAEAPFAGSTSTLPSLVAGGSIDYDTSIPNAYYPVGSSTVPAGSHDAGLLGDGSDSTYVRTVSVGPPYPTIPGYMGNGYWSPVRVGFAPLTSLPPGDLGEMRIFVRCRRKDADFGYGGMQITVYDLTSFNSPWQETSVYYGGVGTDWTNLIYTLPAPNPYQQTYARQALTVNGAWNINCLFETSSGGMQDYWLDVSEIHAEVDIIQPAYDPGPGWGVWNQ